MVVGRGPGVLLWWRGDNGAVDRSGLALDGACDRAMMLVDPPASTLGRRLGLVGCSIVAAVEVMRGGSTAAMHRVTLTDHSGREPMVALRRYVLDECHR
jgi:hypothetical protein